MPERIEWLPDGTASGSPFNPRFGDRYRSESGGIDQARDVFLGGCGLPAAWANQPQWCVLETGFGLGLNFLVTWAAWRADSRRPRLLHFVSVEAFPASRDDVLRGALAHPELLVLAQQLHRQLWGLLPGIHRLAFEGGQVLLTLCIGDAWAMLRECVFQADSVYLDGFSPALNPGIWDLHTLKAVARCCRRGSRVATWTVARSVREVLAAAGFVMSKEAGTLPKRDNLRAEYQPAWTVKRVIPTAPVRVAGNCIVIGSGLAGAAVAASLARRGWQVRVVDAAAGPAAGASGLPAGLMAPLVSPDDSLLSRLSRSGVRATLQQAELLLQAGSDWNLSGLLERCMDHARKLPDDWVNGGLQAHPAADWSAQATADQLLAACLPPGTAALWHKKAGWIKPARLVRAWLQTPGVTWCGSLAVNRLVQVAGNWQLLDAQNMVLASAGLVVLAAGHASSALAAGCGRLTQLKLQEIRGQVSWGVQLPCPAGAADTLPPWPVNGHGSLLPSIPLGPHAEAGWLTGSTYQRDQADPALRAEDAAFNLGRLQELLPASNTTMQASIAHNNVRGWAGVRCATPNRLPLVGPVSSLAGGDPELWVCTGMGSRGLTFAALCAELLAARLHGEPLPIAVRLADALLPRLATNLPPAPAHAKR